MFQLPLTAWIGIAGLVAVLGLGGWAKIQGNRLDACKAESAAFVAKVEMEGEAAKAAAKAKEKEDLQAKEKADATTKKLLADNAALGKRLRAQRADSSILPVSTAPAGSPASTGIRFDRAKLESALQQLDVGISELVAEGDVARLKLATAAEWAKSLGSK